MNSSAEPKRDVKDAISAFRRLALARGVMLGSLESGRRAEYRIVAAAAALSLAPGRVYSEPEVNVTLKAWLAGPGDMLAADHVELRRALVDARLIERDGYGRQYRRTTPGEEWQGLLAELEGTDLAAEARAARETDAGKRALRKARWQEQQQTFGRA